MCPKDSYSMQSVDHYSLPTATDRERLLSNMTSPNDDPLTEIASADELQPTITELDGPMVQFVPIEQSMVPSKRDSEEATFLSSPDHINASRQESGEVPLTSSTATNSPPPPCQNKRNENKKASHKLPSQAQKPQKQEPPTQLFPALPRPPPPAGLPYYPDHSYPSLVSMPNLHEPHPQTNPLNPQINPLLLQCHIPQGGYQLTRPLLEDHPALQQCPCYLTHSFTPHSAPPYQHIYVPLHPGSAPYAPIPTSQDALLIPDMYTGARQTFVPTQPYPTMDHIFPYDPAYQRPSLFIPYAVQDALTTLQPPVAVAGKGKTQRVNKKETVRKRDLAVPAKPGEDLSLIKKSKVDSVPQAVVPEEVLVQPPPHPNMPAAPYYRPDNMLPCITTNFNPYYSQFVPTANNLYPQGHIPYYQPQQQIEPDKRQQSRRALFQYQGAPLSEDSLGVQPLENTPQTKMSPTSTSITTPEVDNSATHPNNSDHPCGVVQQNSGNTTLLRQNRANIPPPISLPPHINNFVISDTIS